MKRIELSELIAVIIALSSLISIAYCLYATPSPFNLPIVKLMAISFIHLLLMIGVLFWVMKSEDEKKAAGDEFEEHF